MNTPTQTHTNQDNQPGKAKRRFVAIVMIVLLIFSVVAGIMLLMNQPPGIVFSGTALVTIGILLLEYLAVLKTKEGFLAKRERIILAFQILLISTVSWNSYVPIPIPHIGDIAWGLWMISIFYLNFKRISEALLINKSDTIDIRSNTKVSKETKIWIKYFYGKIRGNAVYFPKGTGSLTWLTNRDGSRWGIGYKILGEDGCSFQLDFSTNELTAYENQTQTSDENQIKDENEGK